MTTQTKRNLTGLALFLFPVFFVTGFKSIRKIPPPLQDEPSKIKGNPEAKTSIVEFSDFLCGHCAAIQPTLKQVMENYPDVKIVFKHSPRMRFNKKSLNLAEAAECAGDQGRFFDYHDAIFNKQADFGTTKDLHGAILQQATELKLDVEKFRRCFESGEKTAIVLSNKAEGEKLFVNGTPTLMLNGTKVIASHSYEKIVESLP